MKKGELRLKKITRMTKIIEYVSFALLLGFFSFLVIRSEWEEEHSRTYTYATPEPTDSPYATLNAIQRHLQNVGYIWDGDTDSLVASDGTSFPFTMEGDWLGLVDLKLEAVFLITDETDDPIQRELKQQNTDTRKELAVILEAIFPDIGGTIADVEPFLQKVDKTLSDGVSRNEVFPYYEVRAYVTSDAYEQRLTIEIRDISQ